MWVIEVKAGTNDPAVRTRISGDIAAWRSIGSLNLTVSEREVGSAEGRTTVVGTGTGTMTAVRSKFALGRPASTSGPPKRLGLTELPAAVPFQLFVLDNTPPDPHVWVRQDGDGGEVVTITYGVMEEGWHVGNIWITLSAAPLPVSPTEAWRVESGIAICEDHSQDYFRYKLRLERDGTHIQMETSVFEQLEDVFALADRLTPFTPAGG